MEKRKLLSEIVTLCLVLAQPALGQVKAPKPESHLRHLFAAHHDMDDLPERFSDLKCALVLIRTATEFGTGFFISSNGDIATASHVLGQRTFTSQPDGGMSASLILPASFTVIDGTGKTTDVPAADVEKNGDDWGADVALLKSGIQTGCWLTTAPDGSSSQGEHLVTLGFPGLAWGSLSIYSGIMSAVLSRFL